MQGLLNVARNQELVIESQGKKVKAKFGFKIIGLGTFDIKSNAHKKIWLANNVSLIHKMNIIDLNNNNTETQSKLTQIFSRRTPLIFKNQNVLFYLIMKCIAFLSNQKDTRS